MARTLHHSDVPTILPPRVRRAFTLVEVMFAVITLGIGLIMLAAIFPVAIQQRKLTNEESTAAAVVTQAMGVMKQVARDAYPTANDYYLPATSTGLDTTVVPNVPYPGVFKSLRNPQAPVAGNLKDNSAFNIIRGNMVLPSDTRLAWIALYRRDGADPGIAVPSAAQLATWSKTMQVIIFAVQARNAGTFGVNDYLGDPVSLAANKTAGLINLQARPVKVAIVDGAGGAADQITITPVTVGAVGTMNGWTSDGVAMQGAYVVIANDNLAAPNTGRMNGRIYRLGSYVSGTTWELAPGNDFTPEPASGPKPAIPNLPVTVGGPLATNPDAFIVGRGVADPAVPLTGTSPSDFEGPAMDVAVYTGFVPVQ